MRLLIFLLLLTTISCRTAKPEKEAGSPTHLSPAELVAIDAQLEQLNNALPRSTLHPRTGKPFTWWQRNIAGAGKVKYKNIYIDSNNKVKAKGTAVANTGDSAVITAAPKKHMAKGGGVMIDGNNNNVTPKKKIPFWLGASIIVAIGGVIGYACFRAYRKMMPV